FTSMYPVIIEGKEEISESIIVTKEMLRNVPNYGIGYGLLMEENLNLNVDIYFNYLGEIDGSLISEEFLGYITHSIQLSNAKENRMPGSINFNGSIKQDKLCFVITYDASRYMEETMHELGRLYKDTLVEIVECCSSQQESIKTASDYSTNDLETSDLSILKTHFSGIED
ncbi:condensation domain-containing protein, partial [Bacillus cereus group sp. BfR-BA-01355]|uniref:condensation domain-containing protein n=1 Tax=Bacillus cereus group sp. BfR-BA-01355 TaxID=2920318 RepID=UPI001F56E589